MRKIWHIFIIIILVLTLIGNPENAGSIAAGWGLGIAILSLITSIALIGLGVEGVKSLSRSLDDAYYKIEDESEFMASIFGAFFLVALSSRYLILKLISAIAAIIGYGLMLIGGIGAGIFGLIFVLISYNLAPKFFGDLTDDDNYLE